MPDYDLGVLKRDKLDPLAAAEVVGRQPVAHRLEELVVAHLFLQPRGDGHQRRYPMRLLALDLCHAREPVYEVVLDVGAEVRDALCTARRRHREGESYDYCRTGRA